VLLVTVLYLVICFDFGMHFCFTTLNFITNFKISSHIFSSCLLYFGKVCLFGIFATVVISIMRKDNATAKNERVHFAPTISTVHTIYQSKQEVLGAL
jgi:hypothetical protein